VHDGLCLDYCDKLFSACGDEYFDPYADNSNFVPFCKTDSLLCSKISEQVTTGADFCKLVGFPISKLQSPTMRLDYDCYDGKSSVGVKYDRLDIDYDMINKRDFPDDEEEDGQDIHPMDWDFIDEDGEDIFDRVGIMIFGGGGWIASLYRNVLGPSMSTTRKVYRSYLSGIFNYLALICFFALGYELFVNRRVHKSIEDKLPGCCKR